MKKRIISLLCVFIFTALSFFPNNYIFASNQNNSVDVEEATDFLENVAFYSDIRIHATYTLDDDDNKQITDVKYALEFDEDYLQDQNVDENGAIVFGGQTYILNVSIINENGDEVRNLSGSNGIVVKEDNEYVDTYIQYLDGHPKSNIYDEDTLVLYQLIPVDSEGNRDYGAVIEYIDDDGPNYKSNRNGEIEVVYIDEFEKVGFWGAVGAIFTGDTEKIGRVLLEALTGILAPCGDAFLHMISIAVGETVTIDRLVYNEIQKVDINFFESGDIDPSAKVELNAPLKNVMKSVINTWYGFFQKLAIIVFMVLLVYIGIKILLTSTAAGKAHYKSIFTSWLLGVVMLFFFPYVMKYAIELNGALCTWLGQETTKLYSDSEYDGRVDGGTLFEDNVLYARSAYGTNEFVIKMLGLDVTEEEFGKNAITGNYFGNNAMMRIRYLAVNRLDFPLMIIYLLLIGQLLAILIIYYKRVFMLAFFITIFPLITMFYPLKKIGDVKMDPFGTWFKEFIVNVFVQVFHAVTYTVIVTIGVNTYLENDNWLFMIMCIYFLFEGEKILRAIFDIKSRTNSIGDLAAAGAMAWSITQKMGSIFSNKDKDKDSEGEKDPKKQAAKDRQKAAKQGDTPGAEANKKAMIAAESSSVDGGAKGDSSGDDEVELGRAMPKETGNFYDSIEKEYSNRRKESKKNSSASKIGKVVGGAGSIMAQTYGTAAGLTLGMAQNNGENGFETALGTAMAGRALGKEVASGVNSIVGEVVDKASSIAIGNAIAKEYMSGKHDNELGIDSSELAKAENEADKKLRKEKMKKYNEIRRKVARIARAEGWGFDNVAEIRGIQEFLDRDKDE